MSSRIGPRGVCDRHRRATWGQRLCVAIGATALAWFVADQVLAHLLFGRSVPVWAHELREPRRWANHKTELYHRLSARWGDPSRDAIRDDLWKAVGHPDLGWVSGSIDPETLAHGDERELNGRRPILLYGDSFARGVGARSTRFQGLCERSDLAEDHAILNYGLGGYGTDQTYLLLRSTVERYRAKDPIVVYSFLLDDDLDRAPLGYKSGVRPRLQPTLDGGVERVDERCCAAEEYFERHPLPRSGYAWRLLCQWPHWPEPWRVRFSGEQARVERVHQLNRHVFTALKRELDQLGVEWFVLIFHGEKSATEMDLWAPHEAFVLETLEELGIPYVSSRRDLCRTAMETGGDLQAGMQRLFIPKGQSGGGHYTPLGHVAAFETLRRGIQGLFQTEAYEWPEPDDGFQPQRCIDLPGFRDAIASLPDGRAAFLTDRHEDALYRIAPGKTPTVLTWDLNGLAHVLQFHASLQPRHLNQDSKKAAGPLRVVVEADGETLIDETVQRDHPLERQCLYLRSRNRITLSVASADGSEPGWLVMRNATLQ